jgi:cellulose synthase operon protein YhjQ
MESHGTDRNEDLAAAETPEDVAVLYSWANLHGAKYRDFSASRREYRAQLRHRAAEQVREQALLAQAEAEAAAVAAESAAHQAAQAALSHKSELADSSRERSMRQAEEAARTAAAERVEAARRAEAAAVAEAAARREEREIAEAHESAQRQAARYADSEIRRRELISSRSVSQVPGLMSDPYTPHAQPSAQERSNPGIPAPLSESRYPQAPDYANYSAIPAQQDRRTPAPEQGSQRRPQGYRPDEASGVRQIYRGPESQDTPAGHPVADPARQLISSRTRPLSTSLQPQEGKTISDQSILPQHTSTTASDESLATGGQKRHTDLRVRSMQADSASSAGPVRTEGWSVTSDGSTEPSVDAGFTSRRDSKANQVSDNLSGQRPIVTGRVTSPPPSTPRAVSPFSQALVPSDSTRGRRAQDDFNYQQSSPYSDPPRRTTPEADHPHASSHPADQAGPAWLYAPPIPPAPPKPLAPTPPPAQSSVADTLQHSRERVAARWFALKGVFEQPGQEQVEAAPVRQKETRTPVLAVFSLAGGVGKTSLVATVGRSLSSLGEKVLLTDTTSHGLLPFYFGASELRQGTVRTFSPPSGSTDAPIYLVSYDVDQKVSEEAAQENLVEEIVNSSRGTHRVLLDLTFNSAWIVRRMARMNPTILVPVAPDMNSVISLQSVEKFFHGVPDADGRPLQPFYLLNQFDASLPLHLDVREVLRRQLGDRLLPFVIRRAPAVSEALAEGMTVVDYSPESAVTEDYLTVATWLRTIAAPATAGFRNVRWSER